MVSERELDLGLIGGESDTWINNRLAYTHGLGLIRFSSTEIDQNRGPRLIDAGPAVREPRIYFGHLPTSADDEAMDSRGSSPDDGPTNRAVTVDARQHAPPRGGPPRLERSAPDAVLTTRVPAGSSCRLGPSSLAFALALGSKELLLSDDITPESRILLHRDVHDRLQTLAPFIQWDSHGGAADRERPGGVRGGRLHHERELSVRRAGSTWADPRSTTPGRRCAQRSTRSRGRSTST